MADIFADDFSLRNSDTTAQVDESTNPFSFSNFLEGTKSTLCNVDSSASQSTTGELNVSTGDGAEEQNPYSFQNFTPYGVTKKSGRRLQIVDDDDEDVSSISSNGISSGKVDRNDESEVLGCWHEASSPLYDTYDTDESEESEHLMKIEKLSKENISLRNELSKMRDEFLEYRRTANKRVSGLQKELEKVRRKEAEETRNLDNVVHMVEENLKKTTTRAVNAEAMVMKLKEEIKVLKEGGVTKEKYDTLVLEHSHLLNTVQEKSRSVAHLMRTAAEKTEPHVKQLQAGIASLHFFAQQFDDICKVAEMPNSSGENGAT